MIEKTNPSHPDKIADRIAGAILDLSYSKNENATCAVEVLIGHGKCNVLIESSEKFKVEEIQPIVDRIAGEGNKVYLKAVRQDKHLANNQKNGVRCGDNGIFKGIPLTKEELEISRIAREIYDEWSYDGKYILDKKAKKLIICQSNISTENEDTLRERYSDYWVTVNPLGSWTGGTNVDSGATNRKLGSDMAASVTGGGLHGKDAHTKADVCCNIWAFTKAQETGKVVELFCAIGDEFVSGKIGRRKITVPFKEISDFGRDYIKGIGGYEAFAEWGLY